MKALVNFEEFARAIQAVAVATGLTEEYCKQRAHLLRKRGWQIKKFCGNATFTNCVRCGKSIRIYPSEIAKGMKKYCSRDCISNGGLKHGMSHSPENRIWGGIVSRCTNKNASEYPEYGGRGITMCDRWRNSFAAFYADMGPKPSPQHSIDRIDNDKGYCPENCRWATRSEQQRNKRNNVFITVGHVTRLAVEWADEIGICRQVLYIRLKRGWSHERAISVVSGPCKCESCVNGAHNKRSAANRLTSKEVHHSRPFASVV